MTMLWFRKYIAIKTCQRVCMCTYVYVCVCITYLCVCISMYMYILCMYVYVLVPEATERRTNKGICAHFLQLEVIVSDILTWSLH